MNMRMIRCSNKLAEVYTTEKLGTKARYHVDIANRTCSCRKWQVTGLPCCHALYFILKLRGEGAKIENFVDQFYMVENSMQHMQKMYHQWQMRMIGRLSIQGSNLNHQFLGGHLGRPKKRMIEASHEKVPRFRSRKIKRKKKSD
jgi:hypothetical protein